MTAWRTTTALGVALILWLDALPAAKAQPTPGRASHAPGDESANDVYEKSFVEVAPADNPIGFVAVDNRLGDIRVEGHDGEGLIIHTFKRGPNNDALDRLKVSLVPDPNGTIRVVTRISTGEEMQPLPKGSVRIDLLVKAPRSAGVKAEVWNGRLDVASMDNGADLRANEGDVSVAHCSGRITVQTASGTQRFNEIVGDIDAQGLIGDMDLSVIRGQRIEAKVQQGSFVGRKIRARHVSIGVIKGSISFHGEVLAGGSYRIAAHRGNVEAKLARAPAMALRARARRGNVTLPSSLRATRSDDGWVTARYRRARSPARVQLLTHVGNIQVSF